MKTKKQRVLSVIIIAFSCIAVGALLFLLHPPCLIYRVTGFLCPACGTTRMLKALLRLDFAAAFSLNPFMFVLLPIAGLWLLVETVRYIQGKTALIQRCWAVFLWSAVLCIALVFAVWRNLTLVA